MRITLLLALLFSSGLIQAEDDYPVSEDSKLHEGVPKGEMIKGSYTADGNSVFPGTEREYQLYIPAGLDKTKPIPFMVFQDGVIYNAPVVFDNLIAKKEIPVMIGIFIKPGVVPAANPNALPRFNRSYEYDSVTDTYSRFLIDEFLPAITKKHGITLSVDPNDAGISGNSSGGICAFMVAWHRSDRFRRVFTGVGTYVGIHGADQLSVLVRKMEPKPIKVYLQSGENDNNLYCGDWWMANQMMERSLTWAGYEVAHTWGTGGHNGKQATAIFPDVMRWLWKGYPEQKIKANPEGKSKWLGYQVLKEGSEWKELSLPEHDPVAGYGGHDRPPYIGDRAGLASDKNGEVWASLVPSYQIVKLGADEKFAPVKKQVMHLLAAIASRKDGDFYFLEDAGWVFTGGSTSIKSSSNDKPQSVFATAGASHANGICFSFSGHCFVASAYGAYPTIYGFDSTGKGTKNTVLDGNLIWSWTRLALSPDQTQLYVSNFSSQTVMVYNVQADGGLKNGQAFCYLDESSDGLCRAHGLCVDTNGLLYVATALGIQVCDQAGRVNFIIPTPQGQAYDVCFGGKDLSELFIACGDKIYKRQTKVHGVVSGQQLPIKPAPPKL